jgi:nitrite transporter NirC
MLEQMITTVGATAEKKRDLIHSSFLRYFVLAMLAGIYVGFGILLIFTIGAPFAADGAAATKALMGASFAVALSLVIFAGSELFTGNTLVMTVGALERRVTWRNTLYIWITSYVGNLAGSVVLALLMVLSGLATAAATGEFILEVSAAKMGAPFAELLFRGILCNILVCLAVWLALKVEDKTAALILIFWCLFAFIGAGFEHSVANMTLFAVALFIPHGASVSWAGFAANLVPVTVGNIIGGAVFVGAAYWFVGNVRAKAAKVGAS